MSRNPRKNFLNVHYVSDSVQTLTIVGHIPQETEFGVEVQWEVISSPMTEKGVGHSKGQRSKWSDDTNPPLGSPWSWSVLQNCPSVRSAGRPLWPPHTQLMSLHTG